MTRITAMDGIELDVFDTGGDLPPLLFLHEYGGDQRSWARQVEHFRINHRCLVAATRGYRPSDAPDDPTRYAQDILIRDVIDILDGFDIEKARIIGLSMGAYTGLRVALEHPTRVIAAAICGVGSGSHPRNNPAFPAEAKRLAQEMRDAGAVPADAYGLGPTRTPLKRKDREAWREFRNQLADHDAIGSAHVLAQVQAERPSLYDFEADFNGLEVPVLLMVGDEDEPCLDINLWLKRVMPLAGLNVIPRSGHLLNLEDPDGFNQRIARFFRDVDHNNWPTRDLDEVGFIGVAPKQT